MMPCLCPIAFCGPFKLIVIIFTVARLSSKKWSEEGIILITGLLCHE
jgi:hypothetical protein